MRKSASVHLNCYITRLLSMSVFASALLCNVVDTRVKLLIICFLFNYG